MTGLCKSPLYQGAPVDRVKDFESCVLTMQWSVLMTSVYEGGVFYCSTISLESLRNGNPMLLFEDVFDFLMVFTLN